MRVSNQEHQGKYDLLDRIFQDFVDLVYFLEFLEEHPALHESYDNYLKDLFGISIDDSSPQPGHNRNRHTSLFVRFIMASLLNRHGYSGEEYDFRVPLANVLIFQAIETLQMRIINDNNERQLFLNNTANAKLWSQLLASRYKDKDTVAHRRIGYCIPISLKERQDYEYEQEQKAKKENKLG